MAKVEDADDSRFMSLALALAVLMIAHMGGSTLWVNSTVLLQSTVKDNFRGRVFSAELALLTLTMAASNYLTGELLDHFHYSAQTITIGIGLFFLIPGALWFITERWWDNERGEQIEEAVEKSLGVEETVGI